MFRFALGREGFFEFLRARVGFMVFEFVIARFAFVFFGLEFSLGFGFGVCVEPRGIGEMMRYFGRFVGGKVPAVRLVRLFFDLRFGDMLGSGRGFVVA